MRSVAGDASPDQVLAFLQPRVQPIETGTVDETAVLAILERPDPGTFFLRYAFGIQRHAAKLLTEGQADRLAKVVEVHSPTHTRWHDERNSLRCKYNEVLWKYAGADESDAPVLRRKLADWMHVRMLWTEQEHLAQYRFACDVWGVLDGDQGKMLLAGEWKAYAKQDTGHTRGDATGRIITRALGKPDDRAAFEKSLTEWSKTRVPLHTAVSESESRERRIVFAMDLNSEAMAIEANRAATVAYSRLYLSEADAIRKIVQVSYKDPKGICEKAAEEAWSEAPKRFEAGAAELIQLLTGS